MNLKFIINLIIMIIFLSCDNTSTNPDNETTTTGGDETNLIEIYYGTDIQDGQLSIANPNLDNVAGFQFELTGASIYLDASGGLAEEYGFTVQVGEGTGIILGVDLSGGTIPGNSSGILTNISVSEIFSSICIENVILANEYGQAITDIIIGEHCIEY